MRKFLGYEYDEQNSRFIYYIFFFKLLIKDKIGMLKKDNQKLCNIINDIGADKIPPAKGGLREWQFELLDLLKTFDQICRENNVKYWLDFGTLLGAIRHKGFIPWDDDADTSILKSDLDKILPILKERFKNSDFIIRERAETCNNFQIRIKHKRYNLGLDIFPVYYYSQTILTDETKKEITNKIINARKIFEKKYPTKYMDEPTIEKAQKDIKELHEKFIAPLDCDSTQKNVLIRGIEFPYLRNEYVMDPDWIFPLKEAEFENYKFLIPNKSEEYLSDLWKNWQNVPSGVGIFEHFQEGYKNSYIQEDEK